MRDFATTALFVAIRGAWVAAGQVGDGAIVIQAGDEAAEAITWPDHGEYENETTFLTGAGSLAQAQIVVLQRKAVRGIALFTDGIERLALQMQSREAFAPFFEDVFTFARRPDASEAELTAFLESDPVCDRTDDDKTLVMAVRR